MKLSRFLLPSRNLLHGKALDIKNTFWMSSFGSHYGISTSAPANVTHGNDSGKIYASYTLFKGKAAMSVDPKLPNLLKLESGGSRVDRKGVVMLTFWPAIGQRKYDWQRKQVFALSPTEVGSLISLGPAESCEFFHDPSMKSSLQGQIRKSLSVTPMSNESGYLLNFNVVNTIEQINEHFALPVTKAEFTVIRTALSYALPHIMGWDKVVRPQAVAVTTTTPKQQPVERPDPDYEWGR
ncbi:single-stranded DNA-binding protein WHY2, mitochondrial [Typha latifolia]|uniref:single-stranded DNA-binding protein WHY2, mitochondrial n=1 Tax=Typha latifolia TaxID=4733 RepID=UPI003C2F742B